MKLSVQTSVTINESVIEELEGKAKLAALMLTAEWVLSEIKISTKTPKRDSILENSAFIDIASDEIVKIVFDTPYARRWYFNSEGVVFRTDVNPNAQDHWMDDFIHGERREELIEMYAQFYREEIGGLLT